MKKSLLSDAIFIVILALFLTCLLETNTLQINIKYAFIPLLICYFLGRYVSYYIYKARVKS